MPTTAPRATRPRSGRAQGPAFVERPRVLAGTIALLVVGWIPTMLLAVRHVLVTGEWPAIAFAFETHVRYLVAGPLVLLADRAVHERIVRAVHELVSGGFVHAEELERFRPLAAWTHRLRASRGAALACLAVALVTTAVNPLHVASDLASRWSATVGLGLFRFMIIFALWRWTVWALFLARVARYDLALVATHPDLAGGLGFLCQPSEAFGTLVLAFGCLVASHWATDVVHHDVPFLTFKKEAFLFALLSTLLGILPLFPFTMRLFRLHVRAVREYGAFARDYCQRFEEKWIRRADGEPRPSPLGTPDLQSLADLAHSFEIVDRSRPFLATPRLVATLALAALLPMAPLFMTVVPMEELLPRLLRVL